MATKHFIGWRRSSWPRRASSCPQPPVLQRAPRGVKVRGECGGHQHRESEGRFAEDAHVTPAGAQLSPGDRFLGVAAAVGPILLDRGGDADDDVEAAPEETGIEQVVLADAAADDDGAGPVLLPADVLDDPLMIAHNVDA